MRLLITLCLLMCAPSFASTTEPAVYGVARTEAARLRMAYAQWWRERPRKIAFWSVPNTQLSAQAKTAGLCDAVVDFETVLFATPAAMPQASALVLGQPSAQWIAAYREAGFTVEPSSSADVYILRVPAHLVKTPQGVPCKDE